MALTAFDEMNGIVNGAAEPAAVRDAYGKLKTWLETTPPEHFNTRRSQAVPPHRHHLRGLWRQRID
jgi:hypothetical protein